MPGEINGFRKRFFGGFNRRDVVDYIAQLAKERNELLAQRDKAVQEASKLSGELTTALSEFEEMKRVADQAKLEALESASKTFSELDGAFKALRKEIETTSAGVCAELETAGKTIASVPSVLERASERFNKLWAVLETEKNALRCSVGEGASTNADESFIEANKTSADANRPGAVVKPPDAVAAVAAAPDAAGKSSDVGSKRSGTLNIVPDASNIRPVSWTVISSKDKA